MTDKTGTVKVYGASDDLIEIDGDIYEEDALRVALDALEQV